MIVQKRRQIVIWWMVAQTVTFLHLNDTHHHLYPYAASAGYARLAFLLDSLTTEHPGAIRVHAGDVSVGDLSFNFDPIPGRAEFSLLKRMGFRYITVGNHELDLGEQHFLNLLQHVGLPNTTTRLLSANLDFATHPAGNLVQPWDTFTVAGKRIGIFGLTTPLPTNILPELGDSIRATDPIPAAQATVNTLQTLGVDAIVLLSHLGYSADIAVAENVAGIHLIIGGHSHTYLPQAVPVRNPAGDTTWIVQVGSFTRWIGVTTLDLSGPHPTLLSYTPLPVTSGPVDPIIQSALDSLKNEIIAVYGRDPYATVRAMVLDTVSEEWDTLLAFQDTPLGNFVSDALQDTLRTLRNTDASLIPLMLISDPLYPGPVSEADLFRASPYGYDPATRLNSRLAVVYLKGSVLRSALLFSLLVYPDMLVQPSGLTYTFARRPFVQILSLEVQGQPVVDTQQYAIGMDVWSLWGVTNLMGLPVDSAETLALTVAEAIWAFAEKIGNIQYAREGRVIRQDGVDVAENLPSSRIQIQVRPRMLILPDPGVPFVVRDLLGRTVAAGHTPARLALRPGRYFLHTPRRRVLVVIP